MSRINRPLSQMRKLETKEAIFRARKRILRYLVLGFLKQEGLTHSAEALVSEAGLANEYELCDNIDLDIILQDYCSYYLMRFNKQPQFCRKVDEPVRRPQTRRVKPESVVAPTEPEPHIPDLPSSFTITQLLQDGPESIEHKIPAIEMKPLNGFLSTLSPDKRHIVDILYQDIIRPSAVCWEDVKGLMAAKNILMESVIFPVRYPEVFTGLLEPWRGVLLHGPPGTGKTLLARAVAAESDCTFFNVTCSTVVNKWRGESENIVKVLFQMASYYSPSIVFIDEVETLASQRSASGEHEASRRLKSQLLTELDGITQRDGIVFLLANSNMPWEIDPAMLRRLEKRIYIPLPDSKTRAELFQGYLGSNTKLVTKLDFLEFAAKTEGYSGSDIKLVCKEALMASVRKMLPSMGKCASSKKDKLSLSDIVQAIERTKPVAKNMEKRHVDWQNEMGST